MKTFSLIKELNDKTKVLEKKIEKGYMFRLGGELNVEGLIAWREKFEETRFMTTQFNDEETNFFFKNSRKFTCNEKLSNMLFTHLVETNVTGITLGVESFFKTQYQHDHMFLYAVNEEEEIPVYKVSEQLVNCLKGTGISEGILNGMETEISPLSGVFIFDKPFTISTKWGEEKGEYATFYLYENEDGESRFSAQLYFQIANFNCYRPLNKVGLEPKNHHYNIENWNEKNKKLQSEYLNLIEKIFVTLALNNGALVKLPKGNKPGLLHTDFEMIPGNGNKKIQHWRRGHIRRQWYGKKGKRHQDAIWIKPTLINSHSQ